MKTYLTPIESCIIHESGWYPIGDVEVTCVPVVDNDTALFARLDTRRATAVASAHNARLVSRATIRALTVAAIIHGTCIEPVILPSAGMRKADPKASWENQEHYEVRIRRGMASYEWAKIHDLECWRRLEAANWDRKTITGNVGKWLQAGAPPGRCYLMGSWVDDVSKFSRTRRGHGFIQEGTDSGTGPHAGGAVVNGIEVPGQHDYMTLTMLERDV